MGTRIVVAAALLTGCVDVEDETDPGFCGAMGGPVVINEVTSKDDDAIELYNRRTSAIDISDWTIHDEDRLESLVHTLPEGTVLPAGGFLVLAKPLDHRFGIGADDGLALNDATGQQIDCVQWPEDGAERSWCRIPDGTGVFAADCARTFGGPNSATAAPDGDVGEPDPDVAEPDVHQPSDAPLRLNELSSGSDRIELVNLTTEDRSAAGWELSAGDGFHELGDLTVPAGGRLVVPRSVHGLDLDDADTLALRRPGGLEVERVSWCDGAAEPSYCRFPDFDGAFRPCGHATFDEPNALAPSGAPLVPVTTIAAAAERFTEGPGPLAWDTQARLWVADPGAATVRVFDAAGDAVGQLDQPVDARGLDNGPGGIMAIADKTSGGVLLVDADSREVLSTISFIEWDDPRGLAFTPDGDLLIAESDEGGILRVTTGGDVVALWVPAEGRLPEPTWLAFDAPRSRAFVALPQAARVEAFDLISGGHIDGSVGEPQPGSEPLPGQFAGKVGGLALHPGDSLLLVADPEGSRVQAWSLAAPDLLSGGGYAGAFGRKGSGCVDLDEPIDVAVSPDGSRIAVSDEDGRVLIYDADDVRVALGLD